MSQVQKLFVLSALAFSLVSIFLFTTGNSVFAIEYTNYTSEKYKIQFEYPSNWTVTEKASRFDKGADIDVRPESPGARFGLDYKDAISLLGTSDIREATKNLITFVENSLPGFDLRIIEEPHLVKIDNKTAGTLVNVIEEKYDDNPVRLANQMWVVIIGSHAYILTYIDNPDNFDTPENIEIRNNLLKSIRFLENPEPQQKSRFG